MMSRYRYIKTWEIGDYRIQFLWPKDDDVCGRFGCGWDYGLGVEISKSGQALAIKLIIFDLLIYYV